MNAESARDLPVSQTSAAKWSHTRLRSFLECPWRYHRLYVLGEAGETIPAFERGSRLHDLIARYGQHCFDARMDSDEPYARVLAGEVTDASLQRDFLRFADRQTWDFEGILGVRVPGGLFETWHELELPGDRGAFRCRIDLLRYLDEEATLEITDWKSGGWSYPDQPEQPTTQLRLYALVMAHEHKQAEVIRVRQHFIGSDVLWSWDLYGDAHGDTMDWLCETIDTINKHTRFDHNPGSWCRLCPCRSACDRSSAIPFEGESDADLAKRIMTLGARVRELLKRLQDSTRKTRYSALAQGLWKLSTEMARLSNDLSRQPDAPDTVVLVAGLSRARAELEAATDALQARVTAGGPLDAEGLEWRWYEAAPIFDVSNPAGLRAFCEAGKRDWGELRRWDQAELRKLARLDGARQYLKPRPPTYKFAGRKPGEEETDGGVY